MKNRPRGLGLLAISVTALAGAARAQIGTIQVVQASSVFDSTDWKQVSAPCPPGTIAFSGGAAVSNLSLPVVVHQSLPQGDPPTSWLALAQERTPTASSWQLTSVALCAPVQGYQLVDQLSSFDSSSDKEITASCPGGKVPIGGGGGIFLFTPDLALQSLVPTATGWTANARELSNVAAGWLLDVKVSCAPPADIERLDAFSINPSEPWDRVGLRCSERRIAIGGGGSVNIEPGGLSETVPRIAGPDSTGWFVTARRESGTSWSHGGTVLCYLPALFQDGFESGDTGAWSSAGP